MQGYVVTTVASAAEGAPIALSDPPAVVVADLWMPGISGVQLCRLLRSEPATEAVPVLLRGPDGNVRDRFWAQRAGAVAYVGSGRMGDLVRAIAQAIEQSPPPEEAFFTQLSGGELDLRDRIAAHLDAALFDSVIAAEIRALGVCGSFDRLFDLLSQFVAQIASYRWLAVATQRPARLALHAHPSARGTAEAEARAALSLGADVPLLLVEDEDALDVPFEDALVETITLGVESLGRVALAPRRRNEREDAELLRVVARELGGPLRIASLVEESQHLALFDPLTNLMNRRAFAASAARDLGGLERHGTPMCLLFLDVDHFKQINDRFGHATGDAVLAAIGQLLPRLARGTDLVGRWGGEEFVVALGDCNAATAATRAEEIRVALASALVFDERHERVPLTASIGVAAARRGETLNLLVGRADHAMYAAKVAGRNRVVIDGEDSSLAAPTPSSRHVHDEQATQ
jgi:two-component system cell cycle response regulator